MIVLILTSKNGSMVPLEIGTFFVWPCPFVWNYTIARKKGLEKYIKYLAPNHQSYWSENHSTALKCLLKKEYLNEKNKEPRKKAAEKKSRIIIGRYLCGVHIFCIISCFVLTECKRFYVVSESMKSDRIRID